jgi:hypothetical protein
MTSWLSQKSLVSQPVIASLMIVFTSIIGLLVLLHVPANIKTTLGEKGILRSLVLKESHGLAGIVNKFRLFDHDQTQIATMNYEKSLEEYLIQDETGSLLYRATRDVDSVVRPEHIATDLLEDLVDSDYLDFYRRLQNYTRKVLWAIRRRKSTKSHSWNSAKVYQIKNSLDVEVGHVLFTSDKIGFSYSSQTLEKSLELTSFMVYLSLVVKS